MKKRFLTVLAIYFLLCSVLVPLPARAAGVNLAEKCSLELDYSNNGVGFADLEVKIFRVAEFSADGSYALRAPFDGFPVRIHGITSQKEWRDAANTLAAYIAAEKIPAAKTEITDETGTVAFSGLETGIYLVLGIDGETDEGTYHFENFCVFLPTPQPDGSQNYHVVAKPKSSFAPKPGEPGEVEFQVVKLWKDAGNQDKRPTGITVDILKNGVVQETVRLDADNNWTYTWTAPEGEDIWTVVEKDVPDAYTVVIGVSGTTFTLTNSRPTPPKPGGGTPTTGDTFPLRPWLTAMCLSGIGLMAFGILFKRKRG